MNQASEKKIANWHRAGDVRHYESDFSYNELHDAFETFYDEYKKLGTKYSLLKKEPCMFTCWEKYIKKEEACIVAYDCAIRWTNLKRKIRL